MSVSSAAYCQRKSAARFESFYTLFRSFNLYMSIGCDRFVISQFAVVSLLFDPRRKILSTIDPLFEVLELSDHTELRLRPSPATLQSSFNIQQKVYSRCASF